MTDPLSIPADAVKRLRDETGAGMMECKLALVEAGGDLERAREILRTKGLADAKRRSGRTAREGVIHAYVHHNKRVGVLIEMNCETDFVANTEEFSQLAREVAMNIAHSDPRWITRDEVPTDVIEGERKIYEEQARGMGKPDNVLARILEGKVEAFYKESVLLDQPYIREDKKTVGDLINELAAKVGENVVIRRFARFRLGEEA